MEGKVLKIIKAITKTAWLMLYSMVKKKKESFLSKIRSKIRTPTFIGDIQRCDVHVYSLLLCCWKRVFAMTTAFSGQLAFANRVFLYTVSKNKTGS